MERFGRWHPVVLHFPIVCLLMVILFEWIALARKGPSFAPAVRILLTAGVITGGLAIVSGERLAAEIIEGPSDLLESHESRGYVAVASAAAALITGTIHIKRPAAWLRVLYLALVHVAAVSVALGADAGGKLHWGEDWLAPK